MSRSYNEISTPNQRGRRQSKNTKRRSSKLVRRSIISDNKTDKALRIKFPLDRDTLGQEFTKKIRFTKSN